MKLLQYLVALILLSQSFFATAGPNIPPEGTEVVVYEDILFKGSSLRLLPGAYTLNQLNANGENWNDRISSIYIPDGRIAYLFEHDSFSGRFLLLSKKNPGLGVRDSGTHSNFTQAVFKEHNQDKLPQSIGAVPAALQWNDRTSSIIIYESEASIPRVVLYLTEHPQVGSGEPGRFPPYCIPRYQGDNCYIPADPIRQIGNGFKNLILSPFATTQAFALPSNKSAGVQTPPAKYLTWDGSPTDVSMHANGFELNVPDITVYRKLNFLNMDTQSTGYGELSTPRLTDFNDTLHGFNLCSGCVLTIYSDINYKGYSKSFNTAGDWNMWKETFRVGLQRSNWAHRMSSFKLTFPKPSP